MKIIKNYFDKMQEEIGAAEKGNIETFQQENNAANFDAAHIDGTIEKILQSAKKADKKIYVIPNDRKAHFFQEIAKDALFIAEQMFLNIVIDTDDPAYGKIILTSNCFFLSGVEEQDIQTYFGKLFTYATDFWIDSGDGKIRLNFWYCLSDEISIEIQDKRDSI